MSKNPFSLSAMTHGDDYGRAQPHVPVSARVYEEMRDDIVSLDLPPGSTLARAELAKRFNVSQSPVREAILRLEQDGLVVSYPQSKTVVTHIDTARIREEHFLRSAVECDVARLLAEKRDSSIISKAKGFLKMQEALVGDVEQIVLFKQLDEAFHEALFAGVNQLSLHAHIRGRSGNLARLRTLDLPHEGKMKSVIDGHRSVLEAIESGNGEKAARTMREHLSGTMERLPKIVAEHRELFV
jgi:DNA-binding GntR family transcriptional regulator